MDGTHRWSSYPATAHLPSFLRLPAEIRETIYEFSLISEKPLVAFRLDLYQRDTYQEAIQPSLTRVSRQVRQESLSIFYEQNNLILHTEAPKATDSHCWLRCNKRNLSNLSSVSLWIRYVTLTNERTEQNGAMCLSLERSKIDRAWRVKDQWSWITVTRRPAALEGDAKFLINKMKDILADDSDCLDSSEGFIGAMTDLKMFYIKEKMS